MYRWASFLLWAAVAALATAWLLTSPSAKLPTVTQPLPDSGGAHYAMSDVLHALQATGPAPAAASATAAQAAPAQDWQLLGIVHASQGQASHALVQAAGQPPRALGVGARLDADTRITAIRAREVELDTPSGPRSLSLPAL